MNPVLIKVLLDVGKMVVSVAAEAVVEKLIVPTLKNWGKSKTIKLPEEAAIVEPVIRDVEEGSD